MTFQRVMPEQLKNFCRSVFRQAGAVPQHAEILADTLVEANLRGTDTHGVLRLKIYATRIENNIVNTDPSAIKVLSETPVTSLIDAADSPGQVAGTLAMDTAIKQAKTSGIGIVGVRNSNNFGAAAYYAMKPLEHDMIGFVCGETGPNLAPYGGIEAAIGSNPFSVAIPADGLPPVVLDIAMSKAAGGKIRKAANEGNQIPAGWIIDSEGLPSTNPSDYVDRRGCLVPFGGHKGSGLSFMISLLAGVLCGPVFGSDVGRAFSLKEPARSGQLYAAISIDRFCDPAEYKKRVTNRIKSLKRCRPAKGVKEIFYPGEIEAKTRATRTKNGIPLKSTLLDELKAVAAYYGIPLFEYR